MGVFYANITLKGPDQAAVAEALHSRKALVTPSVSKCTVVFDAICDQQDAGAISGFASRLSRELHCPAWAVVIHDDDVLWYRLFVDGRLVDEYNSCPGYFAADSMVEATGRSGGNAEQLCNAFGTGEPREVATILHRPNTSGFDGYVSQTERHADLVHALSLPEFAIGKAYASFERGEYPDGLSAELLLPHPPISGKVEASHGVLRELNAYPKPQWGLSWTMVLA